MTVIDKGDGYDIIGDDGTVRGSYRNRKSAAIHHAMQIEHCDRLRRALADLIAACGFLGKGGVSTEAPDPEIASRAWDTLTLQ